MPATSKSQQRLMGAAYAVKAGYMLLSDVSAEYQDKVKDLTLSMTLKQLKDFAETPHEGLPETVEESSLGFATNTGGPQSTFMPGAGMGAIKLPNMGTGEIGSGDVPKGAGWAEDEYEKEKKKKKRREQLQKKTEKPVKTFEQFIFEKLNPSIKDK